MSASEMKTPLYFFYEKLFREQVDKVKAAIGESIPLCYSIKANPFLLGCVPAGLTKLEVCSPGELRACMAYGVDPERIIYSGVMKEAEDVALAVEYGVGIMTAESPVHLTLENDACLKAGITKKVILRLSSGNQFGMDKTEIIRLISEREEYKGVQIIGIHYYSGTQKKLRSIEKDFKKIDELLVLLKSEYGFEPELVEYGPGLSIDYFHDNMDETDSQALADAAELIKAFAEKYPLGIEMGRYLASDCGVFVTQVKDLKTNAGANYVICDGGIHHLKYYGQNMAMLVPPMAQAESVEDILKLEGKLGMPETSEEPMPGNDEYCICGSLCTVADVLVRNVWLKSLNIGDYLAFGKCGAYSVTEGSSLFLSRNLPSVYLVKEDGKTELVRAEMNTFSINTDQRIL